MLKRHGIPPAAERQTTTTWHEFIRTHMDVLVATDFFTTEVWTWSGLVTYYVLFFIHLGSRKVHVAGITPHPHEAWMVQIARNMTMDAWGFLSPDERTHQGKGNVALLPSLRPYTAHEGPIKCRERLGGLLKYYDREAA